MRGHEKVVERLLGDERIDANTRYDTALYDACENDHVEVVELLLRKAGIDVNMRGSVTGDTPLHRASIAGHAKVVEYQLKIRRNRRRDLEF